MPEMTDGPHSIFGPGPAPRGGVNCHETAEFLAWAAEQSDKTREEQIRLGADDEAREMRHEHATKP